MKNILCLSIVICLSTFIQISSTFGQVSIDDEIDPSAALSIGVDSRTYGGLKIPSYTLNDLHVWSNNNSISNGVMAFNSTNLLFSFFDDSNSRWQIINPWTGLYNEHNSYSFDLLYTMTPQVGIGTNSVKPANKLEVNGRLEATTVKGEFTVPSGGIIMYSGNVATSFSNGCGIIDTEYEGWAICDGNNGTPDLSGRFIVGYSGSGDYANTRATGGEMYSVLNESNLPKHAHNQGSLVADPAGEHNHSILINEKSLKGKNDNDDCCYRVAEVATEKETTFDGIHSHAISGLTGEGNGISEQFENRPPYYVVAFIMKLDENTTCPN